MVGNPTYDSGLVYKDVLVVRKTFTDGSVLSLSVHPPFGCERHDPWQWTVAAWPHLANLYTLLGAQHYKASTGSSLTHY